MKMADMESRPVVVLDSCCVIEWLEYGRREEARAVERLIDEAARKKTIVLVSAAVIAEILPGRHEHYGDFHRALSRGEITVHPLDAAVAEAVAYLREELRFANRRKTMDAIHLGTAVHFRANYLCTTDKALLNIQERLPQLREHKPAPGFRICKPQEVAFSQ